MPGKPKLVVSALYDEVGGMLGTSSASELPRNRRQVYNIHGLTSTSTASSKIDPIFELVQQCKLDVLPGERFYSFCQL